MRMIVRPTWRSRLMNWWWDFIGPGHISVQNKVGRVLCWFAGHEQGRSIYCDWCGKDMS